MFRKTKNPPAPLSSSSQSDLSSDNEPKPQLNSPQEESGEQQGSLQLDDDDSLEGNVVKKREVHQQSQSEEESESEEEDSEDDGEYFRKITKKGEIGVIKEDEEEGDESFDHIEQRIKKLEKDLESKIHNQHNAQAKKDVNNKFNGRAHPPIPQKKVVKEEGENRMGAMNIEVKEEKKVQVKKFETFNPNNNNLQNNIKVKKTNNKVNNVQNKSESKIQSKNEIKSETKLQSKVQSKAPSQHVKKTKPKKQQPQKETASPQFFIEKNNTETQTKLSEMQKAIKQLKLQNQILKQKLEAQKTKKQKPKNKTVQQFEKVKQRVFSSNNKLQKQIELLQVIEKLQSKLKKSINKKLEAQANATASHKPLPIY